MYQYVQCKRCIIIMLLRLINLRGGGGGCGGFRAYHFGKKDFELGVEGEGQDTSRHFEDSFGSMRAILLSYCHHSICLQKTSILEKKNVKIR